MNGEHVLQTLRNALDRWAKGEQRTGGTVRADLDHIEAFALATIALELHEIRLTLQAQHEERIGR